MKKWIRRTLWLLGCLVILILAGATSLYVIRDAETRPLDAAARQELGGTYLTTAMGTTHYQLAGEPDQPLIVLVHGFSIPSYIWNPTFDFLRAQGFRVLRFDLFGRGLSDRPDIDYAINDYVRQLQEVLTALDVQQPFSIVGMSMGGAVVTRFTHLNPGLIDRVVLLDPLVKMPDRPEAKLLSIPVLAEFASKAVVVPKIENGLPDLVLDPATFPDWSEKFALQKSFEGYAHAISKTVVQLNAENFLNDYTQLGNLNKDVLLIWGREDKVTPLADSEVLKTLLPNVEFHLIENAGHVPHYEKPEQVNPLLQQFLQGTQTSAPISTIEQP